MCNLADVAGTLRRCASLAVLVLQRVARLAAHPATSAKLHNLFLRGPLAIECLFKCKSNQIRLTFDTELAFDIQAMCFHCAYTQIQLARNVFV